MRAGIADGGLALLAGFSAAIKACGTAPDILGEDAIPAGRAVLSDDGSAIRLAIYSEKGAVAVVMLDPVHAVQPFFMLEGADRGRATENLARG